VTLELLDNEYLSESVLEKENKLIKTNSIINSNKTEIYYI
jgi:hypothetical protein